MNKKVSIIIPVYNSMKYLRECVSSIASQTYRNIEILLVNDGSTDESGALCDELALKDPRILAIHRENGGTSAARNTGLSHASGDYITFTDNDDYWCHADALEKIMERVDATNADMVLYDSIIYWQDTDRTVPPSSACKREMIVSKPAHEAILHFSEANVFSAFCVWGKLIRASLIRENGVRFPEGMRNEDIDFCADLLRRCERLDWYEDAFYVYRKGHASAQTKGRITYRMLGDLKTILIKHLKKNEKEHPNTRRAINAYLAFPYATWLGQAYLVKDKRVSADFAEMKQYRYLLKESKHPNVRLVYRVSRLLGLKLTARLLAIYLKKRNHLE
jgi:glycosyltransferase involved in cell wall biosynthesis